MVESTRKTWFLKNKREKSQTFANLINWGINLEETRWFFYEILCIKYEESNRPNLMKESKIGIGWEIKASQIFNYFETRKSYSVFDLYSIESLLDQRFIYYI